MTITEPSPMVTSLRHDVQVRLGHDPRDVISWIDLVTTPRDVIPWIDLVTTPSRWAWLAMILAQKGGGFVIGSCWHMDAGS